MKVVSAACNTAAGKFAVILEVHGEKWNVTFLTSYVSYDYQQGILIGYISKISTDANNLTRSGTITPAVDFEHIEEVLVILNKKQTTEE